MGTIDLDAKTKGLIKVIRRNDEFSAIHRRHFRSVYGTASSNSDDLRTPLGAVIAENESIRTIATGANHFPLGLTITDEQLEDSEWVRDNIIHAEPAAIYQAASNGFAIQGTTMYVPLIPCNDCTMAIIDSEISKVITHKQLIARIPEKLWDSIDFDYSLERLKAANVQVFMYDGKIGNGAQSRFLGKDWKP
jgi:deoxycytidylate deaminase